MNTTDSWSHARRLGGLRRFAVAITVFTILGHTVLGFEQSWIQPVASLLTAYAFELVAEWTDALIARRRPYSTKGWKPLVDCLLPAHITGLAVVMLLYSGNNVLPIMFASAVAIVSKATLRFSVEGRVQHPLNPSNFGITATLLVFPWVSIAPPYHFTENLSPMGSVILPIVICILGTVINFRFTGRLPVVIGWWTGFVAQAAIRNVIFGAPLISALGPMTGVAFMLFSFYMITDPATTPHDTRSQIIFGLVVAALYGMLVLLHVVFGFFFALTLATAVRGLIRGLRRPSRVYSPARSVHFPTSAIQKTAST
jgi:Na+-translocating ferredoxin:NAD+ oxidoreductase RnfD subunit